MSNIYFTSDQHNNHENKSGRGIIQLMNRPFKTLEEMHEELADRHNSIVKPGDIVWNLGDFAYSDHEKFVRMLNGNQNLVKGNHDKRRELKRFSIGGKGHFQSIQDVAFIKVGDIEIFLSHYAHRVWNKSHYGSWHLFGHSHGMMPDSGKSCDVGVDAWDYTPVGLDQLIERFKDRESLFHHPDTKENSP